MTVSVLVGFLYVLAAGILQGVFLLPMDRARHWQWEHTWLAFSFFGMLALNWLFTLATIPEHLRHLSARAREPIWACWPCSAWAGDWALCCSGSAWRASALRWVIRSSWG